MKKGKQTMFLTDGNYEVCLSATGYWSLNKELVVNSATETVSLSFEGYKHLSFKVKNGENMDIHVSHFYLYTQGEDLSFFHFR